MLKVVFRYWPTIIRWIIENLVQRLRLRNEYFTELHSCISFIVKFLLTLMLSFLPHDFYTTWKYLNAHTNAIANGCHNEMKSSARRQLKVKTWQRQFLWYESSLQYQKYRNHTHTFTNIFAADHTAIFYPIFFALSVSYLFENFHKIVCKTSKVSRNVKLIQMNFSGSQWTRRCGRDRRRRR